MEMRGATINKDGCMEIRLQLDQAGAERINELCAGGVQPHDVVASVIELLCYGTISTANFTKSEKSPTDQYVPGIVDGKGLLVPVEQFMPMLLSCDNIQESFERLVKAVVGTFKVCQVYQRIVDSEGRTLRLLKEVKESNHANG